MTRSVLEIVVGGDVGGVGHDRLQVAKGRTVSADARPEPDLRGIAHVTCSFRRHAPATLEKWPQTTIFVGRIDIVRDHLPGGAVR